MNFGNRTLINLVMTLNSKSPMIQSTRSFQSSNFAFSKLSLNRFTSSFFSTSSINQNTKFQYSSFSNFLDTPIKTMSMEKYINKVFDKTIETVGCKDSFNVFHCSFQNCQTENIHGGGAIAILNENDAMIRIGYCSFSKCSCKLPQTSGGAILITDGNGFNEIISNCFTECKAGLRGDTFTISYNDETNLKDAVVENLNVENCGGSKLGFNCELRARSITVRSINITNCEAKTCPTIRELFNSKSSFKYVNLYRNKASATFFMEIATTDSDKVPEGMLDTFNFVKSSKRDGESIIVFEGCDIVAFRLVFASTSSRIIIQSRSESGSVQIYDSQSDRVFYSSGLVQYGEGCRLAEIPSTFEISNVYDPGCYHSKSVERIAYINWQSIVTGVGITVAFFLAAIIGVYLTRKYKKSVTDKIDQEVIGDLTALVN